VKLHQVLFDEIYAQGVRQIFGIPGDFVLNLYEALSQDGRFQLVTFSHEPAVGFAADGASRITNGLGVCVVTYGAGGLNLLNSIACAYAEESPIIVITGGVLATCSMLLSETVKQTMFGVWQIFASLLPGRRVIRAQDLIAGGKTVPYGVAITLGSLISVALSVKGP